MPRLSNRPTSLAVACDQRVTGSLVYSNLTIRTAGDSGLTPETAAGRLASLYFSELPHTSAGLFRAGTRRDSRGEHLALYFRLAPFLPFVILGSPGEKWAPPQASVSYPITGGLLASRPAAGALVFAAADPKAGACGSVLSVLNHPQLNHQMQVEQGILADESSELLKSFFRERR